MPYMRKQSVLRPFRSRGMGQPATCAWYDINCWIAGGPQPASTPPPAAAAPAAPTAAQLAAAGTSGGGYTPEMSEAATGQQTLTNWQQFFGSLAGPSGAQYTGPSTCDWTEAAWLDPSTWCGANWVMAGLVGLGVVMLFRMGGRR
jgi:hypothetical protein